MLIKGRAYFSHGHPAADVTLWMYHVGFGGSATVHLGDAVTTADGSYSVRVEPHTNPTRLEVRLQDGDAGTLLATVPCQPVTETLTLNLVVPVNMNSMASEFERLHTALRPF